MQESESLYLKTFEKKEDFKPVDCLVLLGHSIEEVATAGGEIAWKPTRLIQKLNENGWRTGERDTNLDPNDESAYVGGGNAVSIAAAEFFNQLTERAETSDAEAPKLVVFAAGRPAYLKKCNTPEELSEGVPMTEVFQREIKPLKKYAPETLFLNDNKNTRDDIEKPVALAFERGLRRIAFVMLDVRIERPSFAPSKRSSCLRKKYSRNDTLDILSGFRNSRRSSIRLGRQERIKKPTKRNREAFKRSAKKI